MPPQRQHNDRADIWHRFTAGDLCYIRETARRPTASGRASFRYRPTRSTWEEAQTRNHTTGIACTDLAEMGDPVRCMSGLVRVRLIVDTASGCKRSDGGRDCLPDHSRQRRHWCKPNVGSAAQDPGVIQTLGPAEIDPYRCAVACKWWWHNGRVVFEPRGAQATANNGNGRPKSQVSKFGRAGFRSDLRARRSNRFAGGIYAGATNDGQAIHCRGVESKTSDGGTLGRAFQDASGSDQRGESFHSMLRLALFTLILLPTQVAPAVANSDAASPDTWSVVGFSVEFATSAVTPGTATSTESCRFRKQYRRRWNTARNQPNN